MQLIGIVGKVVEITDIYKAIVSFTKDGSNERALLSAEKLVVNGKQVQLNEKISDYVSVGSVIKFSCHSFDNRKSDHCGWYITSAIRQNPYDIILSQPALNPDFFEPRYTFGKISQNGVIHHVAPRQGVIAFFNSDGVEEYVLFLASKCYVFGKRLSSKCNVDTVLALEEPIHFDAIPTDPSENDMKCSWFATVVWKGNLRPRMEYDGQPKPLGKLIGSDKLIPAMKQLVSSPKACFIHAAGVILNIINEEIGIALVNVRLRCWESVLFHRSVCYLFKECLAKRDLRKVYKPGDRIKFIGVTAPKIMIAQLIASQITTHIGPLYEESCPLDI